MTSKIPASAVDMTDRYLDLLARTLTRYEMDSPFRAPDRTRLKPAARKAWDTVQGVLSKRQLALVRTQKWDYSLREEGKDWPSEAETMVGLKRLQNLRDCIETIIADGIEGDLVETGVWRGGASIFMRACLVAKGGSDRQVYLCDSYEGLPPPDLENYPQDSKLALHEFDYLAVSKEQVQGNFRKYGLLDDNVHFVKGWFKDTMPTLPVEKIALLRLDGDMYESTIQVLEGIYDKVVPGGFIVVDDYLSFPECKQACEDFRKARGITDPVETIDWSGVFWRKSA